MTDRRERVLVNGTPFEVIEEQPDGEIVIRRPNGSKQYIARRLPDSPLYGAGRATILAFGAKA